MQNYPIHSAFRLMHKDDIVADIKIDDDSGKINNIDKIYSPELFPLGGVKSLSDFQKWWERRAIPLTRKGVPAALSIIDLKNTENLLVKSLGLSLNDHYWINPGVSDVKWKDINLFDNSFLDVLGDYQFTNDSDKLKELHGETCFSPSASLQGELKKKWIIGNDGERYLVKGNYGLSCQQSLNEVVATKIHKMQRKVPFTEYRTVSIDTTQGENLGCICKNFATSDIEFIPAIDICNSIKKNNSISEFESFIQICAQNGLESDEVRTFLEYQILSDFAMTNTDRHFNNFGILRDSNTLKFLGMAPIYDTGNSMFWNTGNFSVNNLLDINVLSFKFKEVQLLNYVKNPDNLDLSKLPSVNDLWEIYKLDENTSAKHYDKVFDMYEKKIIVLDAFQNGLDINKAAFESKNTAFEKLFNINNNIPQD